MKQKKSINQPSEAASDGFISAFLRILLPLCGFWAYYDMIISILQNSPIAYGSFFNILPAFGISGLFLILLSTVIFFAFILPLRYLLKLTGEALIFSWIVLFSTFMFILFSNNLEYAIFIYLKPYTFIYPAVISLVVGSLAYFGYMKTKTKVVFSRRFTAAVPIIGMEALIIIWFFSYHLTLNNLNSYILMFICTAAVSTHTLRVLKRKSPESFTDKLPGFFLMFIFLCALTGLKGLLSHSPDQPLKSGNRPVKRIILLSVDTLRPDYLSCYNSEAIRTPGIDQLADDGVLFQHAFSTAPWTLPAFASVMTGLPVSIHMTFQPEHVLPDTLRTLAEILHDAGYYTAAIGSNQNLAKSKNICQGFDEYHFFPVPAFQNLYGYSLGASLYYYFILDRRLESSASTGELTEMAVNWLKTHRDDPFFLWLHYLDPHLPYSPPKSYIKDIKPPAGMPRTLMADAASKIRSGIFKLSPGKKEYIKRLYNAEIEYVDDNIALLIDTLKEMDLYEGTLIVFLSDHGEEFWEHGGFEHGHTLYNELLWIPFIVKPAGIPSEHRIKTVRKKVSVLNIMPTILEQFGIDPERKGWYEESLSVCWHKGSSGYKEKPIVSTGLLYFENRRSVIDRDMKYIRFNESDRDELYNLSDDPRELFPIQKSSFRAVLRARKLLENEDKESQKIRKMLGVLGSKESALSPEARKALKSIGYFN